MASVRKISFPQYLLQMNAINEAEYEKIKSSELTNDQLAKLINTSESLISVYRKQWDDLIQVDLNIFVFHKRELL